MGAIRLVRGRSLRGSPPCADLTSPAISEEFRFMRIANLSGRLVLVGADGRTAVDVGRAS